MVKKSMTPVSELKTFITSEEMTSSPARCFSKALTAGLLLNRVVRASEEGIITGREKSRQWEQSVDAEFMKDLQDGILSSPALIRALGFFASDSPLGDAAATLELTEDQDDLRSIGSQDQVLGSFAAAPIDEDGASGIERESAEGVSLKLCSWITGLVLEGNTPRATLLKLLNCVILVEEVYLCSLQRSEPDKRALRKISTEYALMRFFGSMQYSATKTIAEMKLLFEAVGNTSRMNPLLSDALDAVQSYCKAAAEDPDLMDVAISVHRPFPELMGDIAVAAQQSRKYRDGEIRARRHQEPTFRSRFSRKDR